ncbi:heavy metal sensor histidine kinase [Acinetobacter pseudolwoffii]|uniref:heavy metal sensor histidine kinase n=1 Tax=Acinetobacter pseudolwoffii TaxID=2053287 RepID=UPI00209ACEE2|nr:heavy metal sensor histidine kinase [Acinetobacter pseudolwoffii]MCO8091911.1 heavy metal sensor histidine kinase [Acinetobacter pseudolwoffii]
MNNPILLPLATRLSIAFALVSCVVFLSVALLSYQNMQQMIQAQQDQALAARISRIEIFLEDAQSFELLVQHPKLYENMLGQEDNLLLLQHQNNRLIEINPLQIHIPALHYTSALQFQNNQAEQPSTRLAFKQVQFDGRSYQLVAGKQLAEGQGILASYLSKLVLYSLLGILLSTLMAWLAGRYILKSMRQLMLATAQVNIQQPNQHIDVQSNTLEVQELRQAMNDMLANIQAAYQQLARFSEDISHELRTPLNNLIGQTQILLSRSREPAELENLLYSNLEEYERLSQMIESMLFIARVEHGGYAIEKQRFNLNDMLQELLEYFSFLAEEKQMHLKVDVPPDLSLTASTVLLQRAVANLISNAITYGQPGSEIIVSAQRLNHRIKISVLTPEVWIAEQHHPHLFERFYQIDDSRHEKAQTGGLGLAIVQSIMQLHQGQTTVENTPSGVIFSLSLPDERTGF